MRNKLCITVYNRNSIELLLFARLVRRKNKSEPCGINLWVR